MQNGKLIMLSLTGLLSVLPAVPSPVPVILDTDIGGDIDDTWALALLLRCPEVDLKLVVGDFGRAEYRAKLAAKLLETAGRSDIPVGLGLDGDAASGPRQEAWVADYQLSDYPGTIHEDGIQAMIDLIMTSQEPVTLLAIGPAPNLGEALRREPRIAERARFVGMYGSVRKGHNGKPDIAAEWNVRCHPEPFQAVVQAPWEKVITPLDTCGIVQLTGDLYDRVRDSQDPLAQLVMANYRAWSTFHHEHGNTWPKPDEYSSILYDTVAVYLCFATDFCEMETVNLVVTDDGFTREDPAGMPVSAALEWRDLDGFEAWLVERLTNQG